MPEQPHDYAVVVGLNDYPRFGSSGRSLEGAVEDAKRFAGWLEDSATGGGLPKENCKLVTSTPEPLSPTQSGIDEAIELVWGTAEKNGGARRLYFYFSGHGQAKKSQDVALCLCHWSTRYRHAALSSQYYLDMLLSCTPFEEVIVLLDCCRVRAVDATGAASQLGCAVPLATAGSKGHLVAYGTEFQNPAFEAEAEVTEGSGPIVRGHFTEALLAGLRGGAAQPGGGVTATGLQGYLEIEVPRIANEHQHTQQARVTSDFKQATEPVFGTALPVANFTVEFGPARKGTIVLEGPDLAVIKEADAATGPWNVKLEKGLHRLLEKDTGETRDIRFEPGKETGVVF